MTNRCKLLTILFLCLAARPVHANCTNPAGKEADEFYNSSSHTYQFCNGTNWIAYGGAAGAGAMQLISTQTASNSASLAWTGLSGSNYILTCQNIIVGSNMGIYIQFGQGGTPTWRTANYYNAITFSYSDDGGGTDGNTNFGGIWAGYDSTANPGINVTFNLYSLSSSTVKKAATGSDTHYQSGVEVTAVAGGWYDGNTTAVTAVRVVAFSGNMTSGSCSLYSLAN